MKIDCSLFESFTLQVPGPDLEPEIRDLSIVIIQRNVRRKIKHYKHYPNSMQPQVAARPLV